MYAGVETSPGIWSCSLLAAKSKLMKETIPRNELSAILLCAELAFMVKSSLGSKVGEVIYLTDSTIALSWCSSETIKLRLFVYNRVMTILRLLECNSKGPRRTRTKINSTKAYKVQNSFFVICFLPTYSKLFLHKLNKIILYEIL